MIRQTVLEFKVGRTEEQLTAHACLRATHRQKGGDQENIRGRLEGADWGLRGEVCLNLPGNDEDVSVDL